MRAVRHSDGILYSQPDEVLALAADYFETLFVPDVLTTEIAAARAEVWSHVPLVVTSDMSASLMRPFTDIELRAAVASLDASSCPGDDGLTRQFFLEYWDFLHQPLLLGLQQMFDTGSMPPSMTSGLIALIPKGGDPSLLRQWRPITLLSSSYKLMAHLISARLQPLMPLLIHGSQTAFIQDRCILDNVFTFYAAAEWAKSSSQRLAVLLLDFEKAYDRVDWDFLEGTLTRLGFPTSWIRGVSGLFRSATSAVTIGGFLSRHFTLGRSVRQGCPLAPYLFLFFAEALSSFLCSQSTPIPGLHLPIAAGQQTELLDSEYADDTLLITEFSEDTLDRVRFLIDRFCLASGARVNWNKSSGILFGTDARCDWGVADGFTWLQPGQSCRYLGFQIGLDVTPAQQFTPVLDSIRRKLAHWSACHLSLAGRALVVNQVLLATAWYIASCWMLHPGVISRLRRLVRNYLWAGSDGTHDTRARVAWHTCILPREQGGLGIIDPEMQSRALISKCIIRGLFPGNEPWKSFVRHAVLHSTL